MHSDKFGYDSDDFSLGIAMCTSKIELFQLFSLFVRCTVCIFKMPIVGSAIPKAQGQWSEKRFATFSRKKPEIGHWLLHFAILRTACITLCFLDAALSLHTMHFSAFARFRASQASGFIALAFDMRTFLFFFPAFFDRFLWVMFLRSV